MFEKAVSTRVALQKAFPVKGETAYKVLRRLRFSCAALKTTQPTARNS